MILKTNPPTLLSPAVLCSALLWLHFFWCLVPEWRDGEYYSYGFFVPPLFFMLAGRNLGWDPAGEGDGVSRNATIFVRFIAVAGILILIPLRMIEVRDPGWRPPFWFHGAMVTVASHLMLGAERGWRTSLRLLSVTLIAWSAVPYMGQIETKLIRTLTGLVIGLTREIYLLGGHPVETIGERLSLGGQVVEVTDGCSGIRSIQSLVMTALFFGELLILRWHRRLILLGAAFFAAVTCNTARAYALSWTQFFKGKEAADSVHDMVGHFAFVTAALMLLLCAWVLSTRGTGKRTVRRTQVSTFTRAGNFGTTGPKDASSDDG